MAICTYCGNKTIIDEDAVLKNTIKIVNNLILNEGVDMFYSGGIGDFEKMFSYILKFGFSHLDIMSSLIIPSKTNKILKNWDKYNFIYDEISVADCTGYEPSNRISIVDRYMIDCSNYLVCYSGQNRGRAYAMRKYAAEQNKIIIDVPI